MTEATAVERGSPVQRLHSFPKVWALGHPKIANLLHGKVVVQEKVDGSQFTFGVIDGGLHCRSKGADINTVEPPDLFRPAVATAIRLFEDGVLTEGWQYRGEAVCRPKHNTLTYSRAPIGGVILFDVDAGLEDRLGPEGLQDEAQRLGLEFVPTFYHGEVTSMGELAALLDRESVLGGAKIEGVVIKNYAQWGDDGKMLMGKYVSEAFKESHRSDWRNRNPTRTDIVQAIIATHRTERRWEKAVERMRDAGTLEHSPRDIGALMKSIPADIAEECEAEIKEALWRHFWPQIKRGATAGFPDWYKGKLAESQFSDDA